MIDREKLLACATEARKNAYAPYSHFTVGAALLADNGTVYCGCNVENASYGLTCCAERTALYKAVSDGARMFCAIAVVGGNEDEEAATSCPPCGICRQALAEFCDNAFPVILSDTTVTLGELLPHAFRLSK